MAGQEGEAERIAEGEGLLWTVALECPSDSNLVQDDARPGVGERHWQGAHDTMNANEQYVRPV